MRIKKCLPFGRAVDSERKKLLLGDECMDFDIQAIKDKLIGFAHRTTTDLMSTGTELGRFTVAPTWMSTSKLADEAILTLPVMMDLGKLERLLTFQFAFRDYSILSLDDFIKGGFLNEEDPALLRAALLRAQELMAGAFGSSFSKVFQTFIDAIQDTYRAYDGAFLRFLIEEVLYRYGQLMSEPWSEGLKVAYNLQDIHSPGNAATLLTTLVNLIVPTRTNMQMFSWKETNSIKRVSKIGKLNKDKTNANDQKKDVKTSKIKLKRERKAARKLLSSPIPTINKVTSTNYCLKRLKKALKLSPLDCMYGAQCRYLHTIPTSTNKAEIQGVIEDTAHPGSISEK